VCEILREIGIDKKIKLEEISPLSWDKTPYTIDKNEIFVCVDNFDSFESLLFMTLHEVAHTITAETGHTEKFWSNFRKLLHIAEKKQYIQKHAADSRVCGTRIGPRP